jgi:GTP cyclohydrolase I
MPCREEQGRVSAASASAIALAPKGSILRHTSSLPNPEGVSAILKADVSSLNGLVIYANHEKIAAGVRMILEGLGEDLKREGLRDTAERVARMYTELLQGLHDDPREHLKVVFDEQHDEMVVVRDVPFSSMCEHHLLPFHGRVHAAYVPQGKVVGLSKIPRVIEAFARRLQVQERLTSQIADLLMEELDAQGVGVVVEASHTCMTMRGIKKPGSLMVTSAMRGTFKTNQATRSEFLSLILHHQPTF